MTEGNPGKCSQSWEPNWDYWIPTRSNIRNAFGVISHEGKGGGDLKSICPVFWIILVQDISLADIFWIILEL